jgi:hypothetical protein
MLPDFCNSGTLKEGMEGIFTIDFTNRTCTTGDNVPVGKNAIAGNSPVK